MMGRLATGSSGLLVGLVVGLVVGGGAACATSGWRPYMGLRTGEVIVCEKTPGVPAVEKDRHGKRVVVAWCNGRNLGR